jgi:phosphocarrier protein HPr/phosphocarrier protein
MTRGEARIRNTLGLHLRSAGAFVRMAARFKASIKVATPEAAPVDGKSILGLATLGATQNTLLRITADGPDEREAVRQLVALVQRGFDEDEAGGSPPRAP